MNTRLRHNEYYDMQNKFDELYSDSQEGKTFTKLYDDIISEENILLAYRSIKGNKGSGTARIACCQYNRLRKVAKLRRPDNPSALYKNRYSLTYKTWAIADIHLFPIANMTMKETRQFDPTLTIYNSKGRLRLQKSLEHLVEANIHKMMRSVAPNRSLEFVDNRLSRYSMKRGLCEISGVFLDASEVECHHYIPISLGGTDKFENLRIIHADVHKLIHATRETTKSFYLQKLKLDDKQLIKVNQYRKKCQLDAI